MLVEGMGSFPHEIIFLFGVFVMCVLWILINCQRSWMVYQWVDPRCSHCGESVDWNHQSADQYHKDSILPQIGAFKQTVENYKVYQVPSIFNGGKKKKKKRKTYPRMWGVRGASVSIAGALFWNTNRSTLMLPHVWGIGLSFNVIGVGLTFWSLHGRNFKGHRSLLQEAPCFLE